MIRCARSSRTSFWRAFRRSVRMVRMRIAWDSIRWRRRMSGAMSLTGFPGAPVRDIVSFCDYGTALHTAFGVAMALFHREKTGEGQIVDGALLATGVTFMQALLAERSVVGVERERAATPDFIPRRRMRIGPKTAGSWCRRSAAICSRDGRGWWGAKS